MICTLIRTAGVGVFVQVRLPKTLRSNLETHEIDIVVSVASSAAIPSFSQELSVDSTTTVLLARQTPALPTDSTTNPDSPGTIGEYTCDASFNATTLFSLFEFWITRTDTDLGARILLFDFNLHETYPHSNNTNPPAPEPLFYTLSNTGILADSYTPAELASDRSNLDNSWFGDGTDINMSEYFTIQGSGRIRSTNDGWPSESYLEFVSRKRALVSFGTIAAGIGYDPAIAGDDRKIFPAGYLGNPAVLNNSGAPKCFFSDSSFELRNVNSSWAQIIDTTSTPFIGDNHGAITDLANCGYSTILNSTYSSNLTANSIHYFHHVKDALAWSWDAYEPANITAGIKGNKTKGFKCASISASDGRWRVTECGERKLVACRIKRKPYDVSCIPVRIPQPSTLLNFHSGKSLAGIAHTTTPQLCATVTTSTSTPPALH